jgi:hypothetical protein
MASNKPLIALRLPRDLHEHVLAQAAAEHRRPGNFIEHKLRECLSPVRSEEVLDSDAKMIEMDGGVG